MSIDFISAKPIRFNNLFDGRFKRYGIRSAIRNGIGYLYNEIGSVKVWPDDNLFASFTSYGFSDPVKILVGIQKEFRTKLFSENEPQYWGFGTVDEWENSKEWFNSKK
jgi:hypothetical protein